MFRTATLTSILACLAAPVLAGGHAAITGYALSADGTALTVMDNLDAPGETRRVPLSQPVRAIAWRPVTGELVGFADGKIVTIDLMTGAATDQGAAFMEGTGIDAGATIAFDVNNQIDAIRAVSTAGDNLVYFPADFGDDKAGSVRRFTDLAYSEGDGFAGTDPQIFANAYTNAIPGAKAGGTVQYALDARTDALVSLANNAGTLGTIAPITIDGAPADILPMGGFDIVSPEEGTNLAYATLHIAGEQGTGLYALDLTSGAATRLGDLGAADVSSFAVSSGM